MSGELIAVLIAGGIAVTPTIFQMIIGAIEKGQVRKHEELMKRIELYETPKRETIVKYLELLGSVCAAFTKPEALSDYSAAYAKASVLVAEETLHCMEVVDKIVAERYDFKKKDSDRKYDKGILNLLEYHNLREHIRTEISPKNEVK